MYTKSLLLAGLTLALFAGTHNVSAHHSYAMFDEEAVMTVEGEVKEFQWTNPHGWIHVNVQNDQGEVQTWSIETGAPAGMARQGWRPTTIAAGDHIQITFHPLRDGGPGGSYMSAVLPDGTVMGDAH